MTMMPDEPALQPGLFTTYQRSGSAVELLYSQRSMTVYALPEHELESAAMVNTLGTAFFSLGTRTLFFLLGIVVNKLFTEAPTAENAAMLTVIKWAAAIFTFFFYVAGCWATLRRRSIVNQIKRESKAVSPP
jgi:hypothetical protein